MSTTTATKSPSAGGVEKFMVLPILVLIMAQMGTSGDNAGLSVANSALVADLGATGPDIQLANMVYSLMAGALMVAGGMLGTIKGFTKTFRIGAILCAIGEVVMALSPSMTVFIWGGRVLVGFGASFMIPAVLGLVPLIYRGKNRTQAYGCIGAASGLAALMPLFLGVIMQFGGMRVTFGFMSVYFIFVLLLSFKLPSIKMPEGVMKFDGVGTGLAASGLFMLLFGMSRISSWGITAALPDCPFTLFGFSPALPIAFAGIVVLAIMMHVEKGVEAKNGSALLPQSFLKTPQVLAGLVASAITFFFMGVQTILLAPYLQLVAGWTPMFMGAMSLAVGIPTFVIAMGIPRIMPNANPRHVIQAGYFIMAISFVLMFISLNNDGSVTWAMYAAFVVAGIGVGTMSSHQNNVVALALDERDAAQSGGVQTTMRNVGQAVGVALLGSVLMFGVTANITGAMTNNPAISPQVAQAVSQKNISLMGNETFLATVSDIPMTEEEQTQLLAINSEARVTASKTAFGVSFAIVLLALLTTPWIKKFKKDDTDVVTPVVQEG